MSQSGRVAANGDRSGVASDPDPSTVPVFMAPFYSACLWRWVPGTRKTTTARFWKLPLTAAFGWMILSAQAQTQSSPAFTNLAQVRALPPMAGTNHAHFKIQGVVTYSDPGWRVLYVQNGPAGVFVDHERSAEDPNYKLVQGQVVEMEGVIEPGLAHCNLADQHLRVLGEAPMPSALELTGPGAFNDSAEGLWVRFTGWVANQSTLGNRVALGVWVHPDRCVTLVLRGVDNALADSLRGSLIEVTGVLGLKVNSHGQKTGDYLLFNRNLSSVRKLKELPLLAPRDLARPPGSFPADEPVRVSGLLGKRLPDGAFTVREEAGSRSVRVECQGPPGVTTETLVEVFGFLSQRSDGPVLTNAFLRAIVPDRPTRMLPPVMANKQLQEINQIIQVRSLSPTEAASGYPVRVIGVLTFCDPQHLAHFVQDQTAGIYLDVTRLESEVQNLVAGQKIEVIGFSGPGDYAPVILAQHLRVLEQQSPFPAPRPTTAQTLLTGTEDSQWVSLHGVIRRRLIEPNQTTTLVISGGDALTKVHIPEVQPQALPSDLVDATIEVRGVCRTVFNERRQLESVELDTPNWEQIRITESAPSNPFDLAVHPISELFQFHAGRSGLHRAHVEGHSLLYQSDGSFFLQDDSGGICVQPTVPAVNPIAKRLEVVGFPAIVGGLPILQDSDVRVMGDAKPRPPTQLTTKSALDQVFQATLVQLEGRVIGHFARHRSELLTVEFGSLLIDGILEQAHERARLANIVPGSIVRLTGVYAARLDDDHKVQSFQVLLRSPKDVTILSQPSWWSARHTTWVLGGLGGVLFLSLAWIGLLRKQVQQRTRELREEIDERKQAQAHLAEEIAERKRMEQQVEKTHNELVEASHQAGMAEVAISVLHNVGNVLTSVNISSSLVADKVRHSRVVNLSKAAVMLRAHEADLVAFLAQDPKGKQLPAYLETLAQHLTEEQAQILKELETLRNNIDHIKEIVAMQQSYATRSGLLETLPISDLVEGALQLNQAALQRQQVQVAREFAPVPPVLLDKHKVLQILVNLVTNAGQACAESGKDDKHLTVRVTNGAGSVKVSIIDNGVGIAPENLTRVFNFGFTTRKDGHGFGLHSGALAAKELGGSLRLVSEGLGRGTTATLELPSGSTQ